MAPQTHDERLPPLRSLRVHQQPDPRQLDDGDWQNDGELCVRRHVAENFDFEAAFGRKPADILFRVRTIVCPEHISDLLPSSTPQCGPASGRGDSRAERPGRAADRFNSGCV